MGLARRVVVVVLLLLAVLLRMAEWCLLCKYTDSKVQIRGLEMVLSNSVSVYKGRSRC